MAGLLITFINDAPSNTDKWGYSYVVKRPSGTKPKLKPYVFITSDISNKATKMEKE